MSHYIEFNPESIADLIESKLIVPPLEIRADLGDYCADAVLNADGSVELNHQHFHDLALAMDSIPHQQASTSDVWQFWTWFSPVRNAWTPLEHIRAELASKSLQSEIRTSDTHPLRIDSVSVPGFTGRIGLTFCPGKHSKGLYGGTWKRDLSKDIAAIEAWGGKTLISLMENHEFSLLGVPDFESILTSASLEWFHLPIQDMQTPGKHFEKQWLDISPLLYEKLVKGESIVIHCRGGLGRTGLLAARMLVECGLEPVNAVAEVRKARKHSIETYAQEHYVLTERWKISKQA